MDYNKLSKESLIHEIEQLTQMVDHLKMDISGYTRNVQHVLNTVSVQTCWIGTDYSVFWHNGHSVVKRGELKCYQMFFGLPDVCEGCQMLQVQNSKIGMSFMHPSGKNIFQIPSGDSGILEFHMDSPNEYIEKSSDQKIIEQYRSENEALLTRNETLLSTFQMFSKALKTPLRALNGYFLTQTDALKGSYFEALKNSSEQVMETLNKFMVLGKFEAGRTLFRKEEFKLLNIISDATAQARLAGKSGDIHLVCAPTIPEVVKGDALNFRLMLDFLFEAMLFVCKSGTLEISVTEVSQTQSRLFLKIAMRGEKAPNRSINEIFIETEAFNTFTDFETYSAALGLQLATKIIAMQNGTLEVFEGLDEEVYIDVMVKLDKLFPKGWLDPQYDRHEKKRILIADHDKPEVPFEVFSDYEVYFAETGQEALELYFDVNPDMVLVHVAIEACDGFEVYDEIERRRKEPVPIIAMSHKLIDNERIFMQDYGFDDYISKPLTEDKIRMLVSKFL